MKKTDKIYVAGHRGLVGSAIVRRLEKEGYENLVFRTHRELDLTNQAEVSAFFEREKPDYIFLAAAKVGGIHANSTYPADFMYVNQMIQCNLIHHAYLNGVKKLLFLGSSCIYPKLAPQPLKEEYLLCDYLEPTNEAYALAKISGLKMCRYYKEQYGCNFISCMPTNLYGINDNFHPENSHVLPALMRKIHQAKQDNAPAVEIWGTGTPLREFLYVDDLADACEYLMCHYDGTDFVNVGTGHEVTIKALAEIICGVVGYSGKLAFNSDKPDGTPRKLLDVTKLKEAGWRYKTELQDGIYKTYEWYLQEKKYE